MNSSFQTKSSFKISLEKSLNHHKLPAHIRILEPKMENNGAPRKQENNLGFTNTKGWTNSFSSNDSFSNSASSWSSDTSLRGVGSSSFSTQSFGSNTFNSSFGSDLNSSRQGCSSYGFGQNQHSLGSSECSEAKKSRNSGEFDWDGEVEKVFADEIGLMLNDKK